MTTKRVYLGLDVGTKRIGVAVGDSVARLAQPLATVEVGENEAGQIHTYIHDLEVTDVVIGRPRNQAGDRTAQTALVEDFVVGTLSEEGCDIHWQDESVTSVLAEERLKARKKPYSKHDIDAEAAAIILQDYLGSL